ncbi:MAG TPA: ABC transporter substrate-binding protein [Streptosporangiaceae bacterium]|jgi:NitT/TauT family transport system substrate-binding protein|nr:ABC transporter substrate-binding protein [Streptosporangiaceae bacterium]
MASGSLLALGCATACSSSSSSSSGGSADIPTVTIGLTGQDAIFADVVLAEQQGFFKQAKVNVELIDQEASATTNGAAGRVDLVGSGTPSALPAAANGRQTAVVYEYISGNGDSGLVVPANSSYKSVMDLSGKRVVTKGAGSGSYGAAKTWSNYIVAHGGKPLVLVPVESTGSMDAETISGQVQAGAGSLTQYTGPLSQGKLKLLVSPSSALAYSVFPKSMVGNSYWGLKSEIQKNKVGITRALLAIRKADQYINSHTVAQVSKVLEASAYLKGLDAADISAGVQADKPFYAQSLGFISTQAWTTTLSVYKNFGLTVNLGSPALTYGSIVNMSYLKSPSS